MPHPPADMVKAASAATPAGRAKTVSNAARSIAWREKQAADVRILVVDDNPANLAAFAATLADADFELVAAQSGDEAIRHLLYGDFALILLDINMPHLDGIQTARLIRQRERSRDVPIIFITAFEPSAEQVLHGYASGAVDYLVKPIPPEILRCKVRIFVDLYCKSQQVRHQAAELAAINSRLETEMASRKEAELDAEFERDERQRVALASIADAVVTTDSDGRVTSLNPVAEVLTGWQSAAARGRPLRQVLATIEGEEQQSLHGVVETVVREDRPWRAPKPTAVLTRERGRRYVDYSVAPVHDRVGQVVGTVLIAQDVTDRHRAELERARALVLEQAGRRAAEDAARARDEFLAVISHELRTPLNAIVGWTQVLRAGRERPAHLEQAIDAIHRGAMAQKKLIEDLLDMSRIVNGKIGLARARISIASVVTAALETVRPLAEEKGLRVQCEIVSGLRPVYADRARMQQVIWNILANAVKFTGKGGTVSVRIYAYGDNACLTVTDTGQGIEPELLPWVFEAFRQGDSTTTRKQGGLGLGLAIARQIVSMHGGTIHGESQGPGRGATFTVCMPFAASGDDDPALSAGTDDDSDPGSADGPPPRLDAVRMLVVDDHDLTLEVLITAGVDVGADVRGARSVGEALALLQDWHPHVLVSDLSMPGEDGFALIAKVRALPGLETLPAIALSAMTGDDDRTLALAAGFDAHVSKPFELDELVGVVASMASRTAPRTP